MMSNDDIHPPNLPTSQNWDALGRNLGGFKPLFFSHLGGWEAWEAHFVKTTNGWHTSGGNDVSAAYNRLSALGGLDHGSF